MYKTILFFVFVGSLSAAGLPVDHGGFLPPYIYAALYAKTLGLSVNIIGVCESACVAKLASGTGLRIAKDAIFAVHEVRTVYMGGNTPPSYEKGVRSEEITERFANFLPKCARDLFDSRHAFDGPELVRFTGQEVLDACPELKGM